MRWKSVKYIRKSSSQKLVLSNKLASEQNCLLGCDTVQNCTCSLMFWKMCCLYLKFGMSSNGIYFISNYNRIFLSTPCKELIKPQGYTVAQLSTCKLKAICNTEGVFKVVFLSLTLDLQQIHTTLKHQSFQTVTLCLNMTLY